MKIAIFAVALAAAAPVWAKDKPAEPAAAEAKPAAPADAKPADAKPAEAKPEEAKAEGKKGGADSWSEDQKTLYTLGAMLGAQVAPLGLKDSEIKILNQGVKDAALEKELAVDAGAYRAKISDLGRTRLAAKAEVRKKKDKAFYDKAAKEKGAKVLESGLVYTELKKGKGDSPTASDTVKANYEGKLVDGTVFDASSKHGGPLEFSLAGVVRCWTEGLQLMKVGGKARLTCPSDIAYGDMGRPPVIPGGATLTFEVELVEIVKKS